MSAATKSNQKTPPRTSAPIHRRRRSAMARYPALLARGGVCRQAIPGLTSDTSASCLVPRQTGAGQRPPRAAVLGAADGEGKSKANCQSRNLRFRLLRYGGAFASTLSRSRTREALPTWQFVFDVPPRNCAEHRSLRRTSARAFWREARQDAEASAVRPWMACRQTLTQARSAGNPSIALLLLRWKGAVPGACTFWLLFVAVDKK